MGGFFAVASRDDCVADLFYGTDYHSHLGTRRGGLATLHRNEFIRFIHDITNAQFRSKFETDLGRLHGNSGIGIISDFEDQPLLINSHLGPFAIVTVNHVGNLQELVKEAFLKRNAHFSEMSGGAVNPTELIATLIGSCRSFEEGIAHAQELISGSCSLLLLTPTGIYAARDRFGRTPVVLGRKEGAWAVTMETTALPNLGYETMRDLGPGEIVRITPEGAEVLKAPGQTMRICAFFWVYFGFPSSTYENINVEIARYRCGAALARRDTVRPDIVAGIPDSGVGHALGYAVESGIPYRRPFVKYTPTWPRSFMPQDQRVRDLVARMKLVPIHDLVKGQRLLFLDDSIVRGTQLRGSIERLFAMGAQEVHMRTACPPLTCGCKYLNFSRSTSVQVLATRNAIKDLEGKEDQHLDEYMDEDSDRHANMVACIGKKLGLTSLCYQRTKDLIGAIGLPEDKLCMYCMTGRE